MEHLRWHEVLGVFKLAVILQQIYVRFVRGQTRDPRFGGFGARVAGLVARAIALSENTNP
jgi:aminoglycoside phosphotransferase (APT) family kinase protein